MKAFMRTHWFAVSLAIVGLVVGYTAVVAAGGFAGKTSCPAERAEQHSRV